MALDDWIDLKRIQPQIGQCDDGAYDAAVCENLNCARDEIANIYDILTLTGNNGDPDYTDDGTGFSGQPTDPGDPVMDEIPPGTHSECSNTVTITSRFCGSGSGDNQSTSVGQFTYEVLCEPEGGGTPVVVGGFVHTGTVTYNSGEVTCSSRTVTLSGIACTGRLLVRSWRTGGNGFDTSGASWTGIASAFCVD